MGLNIPILWTYGYIELNGRFVWNNLGFKVTGVVDICDYWSIQTGFAQSL